MRNLSVNTSTFLDKLSQSYSNDRRSDQGSTPELLGRNRLHALGLRSMRNRMLCAERAAFHQLLVRAVSAEGLRATTRQPATGCRPLPSRRGREVAAPRQHEPGDDPGDDGRSRSAS